MAQMGIPRLKQKLERNCKYSHIPMSKKPKKKTWNTCSIKRLEKFNNNKVIYLMEYNIHTTKNNYHVSQLQSFSTFLYIPINITITKTHLSFESPPLLRNDDNEKKDRGAVQTNKKR